MLLISAPNHQIYIPIHSKSATAGATAIINCYTPLTNSLHRVTSVPGDAFDLVLKDFSMVGLSHYIYVIGGRLCSKSAEHGSAGEDRERAVPSVRRYNVRTDTWETCAAMSNPRFNFACIVSNDKIFAAGGQSVSGRAEGVSSAEVYDPVHDKWNPLANMRMARYNCVGFTWKGRIHVVGGFIGRRPYVDAAARCSVEIYDEKQDRWDFSPRMWNLDTPPNQIVAVNQKLFSSGDCLRRWKGYIEMYDENDKMWTAVHGSDFDFTATRLYSTMASISNQLYFLAAYKISRDDSRLRLEVRTFDTAANGEGWRSFDLVEDDGEEICGHCCVLKQD